MYICDHVRLLNLKASPGVLAGGCDVYRCSKCRASWMMYREDDELVVDGRRSDGEDFIQRYPLMPASQQAPAD